MLFRSLPGADRRGCVAVGVVDQSVEGLVDPLPEHHSRNCPGESRERERATEREREREREREGGRERERDHCNSLSVGVYTEYVLEYV